MKNPFKMIDDKALGLSYTIIEWITVKNHVNAMNNNDTEKMKDCREKLEVIREQKRVLGV